MNERLIWKNNISKEIEEICEDVLRDERISSLSNFSCGIPVNPQKPIMIQYKEPENNPEPHYSIDVCKGWRVFNKDIIDYDDKGRLLVKNKPKYNGVYNLLLSKELRSFGYLIAELKFGHKYGSGVNEQIGFSDATNVGGCSCVILDDSGFWLGNRNHYGKCWKNIEWDDRYIDEFVKMVFLWTPYTTYVKFYESVYPFNEIGEARNSSYVPDSPLDIGIVNMDSDDLGETCISLNYIEFYPLQPINMVREDVETVISNYEIRDTNYHFPDYLIHSNGYVVTFYINNTHNQDVKVDINGSWDIYWTEPYWIKTITAPSGSRVIGYVGNYGERFPYYKISLKADNAPTEGSITVRAYKTKL